MPELEYQVEYYGVAYVCDDCGDGYMIREGNIMLTMNPPLFPHRCTTCGATKNLEEGYPTVRFRTVEK